jgi:hypothetical protein
MNSSDYKERFKAEYLQTKIRYEKLHKMTIKYEANKLTFTPHCSLELLNEQKKHMGMYLHCLEVRAEIEGISLENIAEQKAYEQYLTTTPNIGISHSIGYSSTSEVTQHD